MKKNGQYVGVDEKYIPEDEKYVDESLMGSNEEVKEKINDTVEKVKPYAKKGLKIAKNVGIGYLIFIGFVFILSIVIMVIAFVNIFNIGNKLDEQFDNVNDVNNQMNDVDYSSVVDDVLKESFNGTFELYSGTKSTFFVERLLDEVITNNKTNSDYIITVVYGDTTSTLENDILNIKSSLEDDKEYEISLYYDANGFVNQVFIR